jgi:hypothetical protein
MMTNEQSILMLKALLLIYISFPPHFLAQQFPVIIYGLFRHKASQAAHHALIF